jgi:hypothetical protein
MNWTEQQIQYLNENWRKVPLEKIMEDLNRTEDSVMRKARRIGLKVNKAEEDILKKRWAKEEENFIIKNYGILTVEMISHQLGRTVYAIRKRAMAIGVTLEAKRWSMEEMEFLNEKWGILNLNTIAKKLNRSRNSILLKAHQMSLREQVVANGVYLTPNDMSSILGINIRTLYSWIWNGCIGHRKFTVGKKRKYQIAVEDLCEFIEKHQNKWNSQKADIMQIKSYYASYFITKNETLTIRGEMPNWMQEKIERDKDGFKEHLKPWTTKEESELLRMVEGRYKYKEICVKLGRSIESVKARLYLLSKQRNSISYIH